MLGYIHVKDSVNYNIIHICYSKLQYNPRIFTVNYSIINIFYSKLQYNLHNFIQFRARRGSKAADQESLKINPPGPAELGNVRKKANEHHPDRFPRPRAHPRAVVGGPENAP